MEQSIYEQNIIVCVSQFIQDSTLDEKIISSSQHAFVICFCFVSVSCFTNFFISIKLKIELTVNRKLHNGLDIKNW
jgi:hypothetical protein